MNDMDFEPAAGPGIAHATVWGAVALFFLYATAYIVWRLVAAPDLSGRIEIAASYFGVVGTLLLATRSRWAGWGFVAFLASNVGWLWFSYVHDHEWMFWQQVAFTVSSLVGVWFWLLRKGGA